MKTAASIIKTISRVTNLISMSMLLLVVLITVVDVVGRAVFHHSLTGTMEVTELMVLVIGFLGLAWCALEKAHLKVDLIIGRFSSRVQAGFDSFTYLLGLGICIMVARCSFIEGLNVKHLSVTSSYLDIPQFPFYYVVTFGMGMLCLVIMLHLIENILKVIKP